MLKLNKKYVENDDEFLFIEITFNYDNVFEFTLTSSKVSSMKSEDWLNFVNQDKYYKDLSDSYGSHCDNGCVELSTKDGYISFHLDTATGGESTLKIPVEKCKDAFLELSDWYKLSIDIHK